MNIQKVIHINMMQEKHFVRMHDFTKEDVCMILDRAAQFATKGYPAGALHGRVIATLFFEPSTRTRLSFSSAALRLGAGVIGFEGIQGLSMMKGETFEDTIRIVSGYADVLVIRHPEAGASERASSMTHVPIINAGDGSHEHPTQTLTDLFAIERCFPEKDDYTVAMVGDLRYGRTTHSFALGLSMFTHAKQIWVAPSSLRMPNDVAESVKAAGVSVRETENFSDVIAEADIIYMTRVQEERFDDPAEYDRLKGAYIITSELLSSAKPTMRILHPLPRRMELPVEIDATPHAYYFEQAACGVPVRAALLSFICGANV